MSISLTINASCVGELHAELRNLLPGQLPPMQEQPRENREPLPESNVKEIEPEQIPRDPPKERKPRAKKPEEVKTEDKGESSGVETVDDAGSASNAIPDIEDLRARLKTLGATEGMGHDKVFEVLGKYGAKNASTVPEEKRAACIAEIDNLLKSDTK